MGWISTVPVLPIVTVLTTSDSALAKLRAVVVDLFGGAGCKDHSEFHFAGFEILPDEAHDSILAMEKRRYYPRLASTF
jgi:hypothetical protein